MFFALRKNVSDCCCVGQACVFVAFGCFWQERVFPLADFDLPACGFMVPRILNHSAWFWRGNLAPLDESSALAVDRQACIKHPCSQIHVQEN